MRCCFGRFRSRTWTGLSVFGNQFPSKTTTAWMQLPAVQGWDANLTGGSVAQHVEGFRVTSGFFPLLGMPMQLGRSIGSADFQPGAPQVVVVKYGFWQQHLGSDP